MRSIVVLLVVAICIGLQSRADSPDSAEAHAQLGAPVSKEVIAGNIRPSADSDLVERAQEHLQRAAELAPYAIRPLTELAELDAVLGRALGQ